MFDYKKETNKLKLKRNFGFNFIKDEPYTNILEEKLYKKCNTPKVYEESINKVLDKLENKKFEDEWDLEINYQKLLDTSNNLGGIFSKICNGICID